MTYEINLNNHQRVEENKKIIAFMALTNDDEEEESESESDEVNSTLTILIFKMSFKNYILILKNLVPKISLSRKRFLVF